MQRLAVAAIFLAIIVAIGSVVVKSVSRRMAAGENTGDPWKTGNMPKLAFFLLLCLILYASLNGAS